MNTINNIPNPEDFFKQKEIGGKRYSINSLSGWEAWDGWTLILETVAPVFGEVLDSRNVDESMMFEQQHTFKEVLTIISHNINKPEMRSLIVKMLHGVSCDGTNIDIDEHFKEKVHEMMELIIFALGVNFKGFFMQSDIFQSMMGGLQKVMGGIDQG